MPTLSTRQRRSQIVELVQQTGEVRVTDLAKRFHVSAVTIRNDLSTLEQTGALVRDHGGATAPAEGGLLITSLPELGERTNAHLEQKRRIGKAAAALVSAGDTILLDAGTTTVHIARALARLEPLSIVTNALNVALELGSPAQELILLGGTFHRDSASTVGALAVQALSDLTVGTLFLGAQALDTEAGLTDSTMEIAEIKRAMIRAARRVVLVADATKWGRTSLHRIASLDAVDCLVSDSALPAAIHTHLTHLGIEVIIG